MHVCSPVHIYIYIYIHVSRVVLGGAEDKSQYYQKGLRLKFPGRLVLCFAKSYAPYRKTQYRLLRCPTAQ